MGEQFETLKTDRLIQSCLIQLRNYSRWPSYIINSVNKTKIKLLNTSSTVLLIWKTADTQMLKDIAIVCGRFTFANFMHDACHTWTSRVSVLIGRSEVRFLLRTKTFFFVPCCNKTAKHHFLNHQFFDQNFPLVIRFRPRYSQLFDSHLPLKKCLFANT